MQQWSQNFNINSNKFVGMKGQRNILIYHPTPTVVISNNELFVSDDGANGGSARELIAVLGVAPTVTAGGIVVQNNFFTTGSGGKGIRIENASTYGANLAINNNHFGGVDGLAIQNSGTGTVTATCNWYGTASAGLIAAKISGTGINYTPWLVGSGDGAAFGFQPTADCNGTGTPPVITCPIAPTSPISCPAAPVFGTATATYSCGSSIPISFADVDVAGSCAGTYVRTRTWTATDDCGNTATCSQSVTVQDMTAPVLTCAADETIGCDESTDPSNTGSSTATDNCGTPAVTYSDAAGQLFPSTFPGGTALQGRARWGIAVLRSLVYWRHCWPEPEPGRHTGMGDWHGLCL
ncbi:MAG: hypothetical protein IPL86_16770 [Flavobacteriales bacterium]|nr:hypothetical protein [Flavobacteriales bacterium]